MSALHDRNSQELAIGVEVRENWSSIRGVVLTPGRQDTLVRWASGKTEWVPTGFLVVVPPEVTL